MTEHLVTLVLITGLVFGWRITHKGPEKVTPTYATAFVGNISNTVSAQGSVVSNSDSNLTFGSSGKVTSLSVVIGQSVRAGQVLATIDDTAARQAVAQASVLVESKEKEIRIIKESQERKAKLAEMLKPLNKEKAAVMGELLESVQTDKLQSAFDKYLPAVLGGTTAKAPAKVALTESKVEVTGDKSAKQVQVQEVAEVQRLCFHLDDILAQRYRRFKLAVHQLGTGLQDSFVHHELVRCHNICRRYGLAVGETSVGIYAIGERQFVVADFPV